MVSDIPRSRTNRGHDALKSGLGSPSGEILFLSTGTGGMEFVLRALLCSGTFRLFGAFADDSFHLSLLADYLRHFIHVAHDVIVKPTSIIKSTLALCSPIAPQNRLVSS